MKKKTPMNRLVLIGNGFDKAHGLPTSYNDFILWYMMSCLAIADKEGEHKDLLLEIKRHKNIQLQTGSIKNIEDYVQHFYKGGFTGITSDRIGFGDVLNTTYTNPFQVKILSPFFRGLLAKCTTTTWVEIENEYYAFLKKILDSEKEDIRLETLDKLHVIFKFIIERLEAYLTTLPAPKPLADYKEIFDSHIMEKDVVNTKNVIGTRLPDHTLVLNFNYTPTTDIYFSVPGTKFISPNNRKTVNHIHGEINKPENPVIFGFGDELDKAYEKMELQTNRGFFSFIKSFWYFKTSNYHNLVRFIDSAEFQVVVLGHSCGLSDRTMLNMIFEHEQCVSIKIYYYGDKARNNYTEITQDISRHFRNKQQLRRKIVPFDNSEPMPQFQP